MTTLQHQDTNVGPASYKHLDEDELLVTKIFNTIQGEGPYAGTPAVFIRLAGCNRGRKDDMGCMFCDTAFYFGAGKRMKFLDIAKEVKDVALGRHLPELIIVTGGEPMMQNNLVGFLQYLQSLRQWLPGSLKVQIESNGDRVAPGFERSMADLVISPKMNRGSYRLPPADVLEAAAAFKFVVSGDENDPYYQVPVWASQLRCPVFVSPLTVYLRAHEPNVVVSVWDTTLVDHEATARNYRRAADIAMSRGFRVSIQGHLWYGVE